MTVPATRVLLERDRELERLDAAYASMNASDGALLVIEGEAGIGKTELVLAAQTGARAAGIEVAAARGSELERDLAFGVVRQLLEPILAADPARREQLFSGAAALAKPVFDAGAITVSQPVRSADQTFSLLHGLHWLCANLAQSGPVLLVVDDAHWADTASLRFLAYLGPRLDGMPLGLVAAFRPAETAADEELLGALAGDPRAVRVSPGPLSVSAVAEMVARESGRRPDDAFAEACLAATGGVPLLVRELIRALTERGVEPVAAAAGQVEKVGPRTVARYVVARVNRISPAAERAARAAAVLGVDAELPRVTRLARIDDEAMAVAAVDALALAGVIATARPIEFVHPVVRAAIYEDLGPGERASLHAAAAALLSDEGADEERIASHLMAAAPGAAPGAAELLIRTARAALTRGAPAAAQAYLQRALAEPLEPALRTPTLHELGFAQAHAGLAEEATKTLTQAFELTEPGKERARVAQDLGGCLRLLGRSQEAARMIEVALAEVEEPGGELATALEADLILMDALEPFHSHRDAPRDISGELEPHSAGTAKYLAALATHNAVRLRGDAARVRELAAAARDAGIVDDLAQGGSHWINAVAPAILADGYELADQMLTEAFDAAGERGSVVSFARAYSTRAVLRHRQGALSDALADAEAGLESLREAGFYFALMPLAIKVLAECERGEPEAARGALDEFGLAEEIPDTFIHNWVLHGRGVLRLTEDQIESAIADFEELVARTERRDQRNPALHPARSDLARALLRAGENERAQKQAGAELELARQWGARRAVGIALRTVGLCEAGENGIARLHESVDVLRNSGADLELANSLAALGAALRRNNQRAEAREPLRTAIELAHRCGAELLLEQAREELLATGARPRRIMRSGVAALTPSELRVARMAADGLTNREIAQALFVTPRTVEGHLTHAFQKLDISARGELADRLRADA